MNSKSFLLPSNAAISLNAAYISSIITPLFQFCRRKNFRLAFSRRCHIEPDWLLVYQIIEDRLVLKLMRTGSHSDLF
ncbi:MAG: type II toxin-antitoxin system mRNA interferase toxin, RelE/StbE family [Selenomonas sp.]|nr:type II toxin-antitoxin system mRNA interferase toxin, RelE/StbE family [Selenomonas sp.]